MQSANSCALIPALAPSERSNFWNHALSSLSPGKGTSTRTSNRRHTALSSNSGWLVAHITTEWLGKRSSCTSKELTTRLISPVSCESPRSFPTASNSSKNNTLGLVATKSIRRRKRLAVSPRKLSTIASYLTESKGSDSSAAITSARLVLPLPGGPINRRVWRGSTECSRSRAA